MFLIPVLRMIPMPCDVFDRAIKEKRDTYDDLVANRRCAFVVLAAGTGGHWHADCIRFVRDLARYRASSEPVVLRRSMKLVEPSLFGSTQIDCRRPRSLFRCDGWSIPDSLGC